LVIRLFYPTSTELERHGFRFFLCIDSSPRRTFGHVVPHPRCYGRLKSWMMSMKSFDISEMDIDTWHQLFLWASVVFAVLAAVSTGLAIITGNAISNRDAAKISELQPRLLHPEQASKMSAIAHQLCPRIKRIPVTAAIANQEAQAYGMSFVKIFKDSGCISDLMLPTPGLTPDVQGVKVGVRSVPTIPDEVQMIKQILSAGNIPYSVNQLTPEFFPDEPFVLIIGAKPTD
jgi:hypothetical protein